MVYTRSVVDKDRFETGLSYEDYVAAVATNKERFGEFYNLCSISTEDKAFFKRAASVPGGAAKIAVIGEAFCPDVLRGLPVAWKLAETCGIELKMFPRDKNLDIMNEFLKHGQFQSIPVMVFYTADMKELGHWIERPELADKEQAQIQAEVKKANPGATEQEIRGKARERTSARQAAWQQESIREWREMLARKLRI